MLKTNEDCIMTELASQEELVQRLALDKVFDEYDPKSQVTLDESEKLVNLIYESPELEVLEVDMGENID